MIGTHRRRNAQRLEQVRRVRDRWLKRETVVASSDGSSHDIFPVAISRAEGEALRDNVVRQGAVRTVEIGLGYGISALYACEGLLICGHSDPRHVVLDPHQSTRFAGCGLQVIDEAGLSDLVEFHPQESQVGLPRFWSRGACSISRSWTATTGSMAFSST